MLLEIPSRRISVSAVHRIVTVRRPGFSKFLEFPLVDLNYLTNQTSTVYWPTCEQDGLRQHREIFISTQGIPKASASIVRRQQLITVSWGLRSLCCSRTATFYFYYWSNEYPTSRWSKMWADLTIPLWKESFFIIIMTHYSA